MADDIYSPGASGYWDAKANKWVAFAETTLLDPGPLGLNRHARYDITRDEPYGSKVESRNVPAASSGSPWRGPQRHQLDREDV